MKKILTVLLSSTIVLAGMPVYANDCDFKKDIQKLDEENYKYTTDCHKEVGKRVKKLILKEKQVEKLEEVIELKDIAIVKGHERTELWMQTSYKLEDRVNAAERIKEKQQWYWFVLGVVVTGTAVWGAGQLK